MKSIYVVATLDTKGAEAQFVVERLRACGASALLVDVGTHAPPSVVPDIPRESFAPPALGDDRGAAVTAMSAALTAFLLEQHAAGRVAGVLGLGGGGGTALVTPAMQALPVGLPKLMVSTMAAGNCAPYVGSSDIAMLYSVVDVAGLNRVSRRILSNAAHAMAGMVRFETAEAESQASGPTVAMTMFGVTTPCVDRVRQTLAAGGHECLVFHATGSGDRAMENLVRSGLVDGVIDATTTAVADEVVGGVLRCGPTRFDAILAARVPYVWSLGALDMVNFGARDTVPPQFAGRLLHVHNAQVTLLRTTADECRRIARWIAAKLNTATAPWTLVIPERGLSALDAPGLPFHDPTADAALFAELEATLQTSPERRIVRLPLHVNDPDFSAALVAEYNRLAAGSARPSPRRGEGASVPRGG